MPRWKNIRGNQTVSGIITAILRVHRNQRIHVHKVFKGIVRRSDCSKEWFSGFKRHLIACFTSIRPKIKGLLNDFEKKGFAAQSYSLLFSYLLDSYIWDDKRIMPQSKMTHHGTWSGGYWAMYEKRTHDKTGTDGFGPVKVNWTEKLGYYPGTEALLSFAKDVQKNNGEKSVV